MLLCCMGWEYIKVHNNFVFVEGEDKDKFDVMVEKFEAYFEPKKLTKLFVLVYWFIGV